MCDGKRYCLRYLPNMPRPRFFIIAKKRPNFKLKKIYFCYSTKNFNLSACNGRRYHTRVIQFCYNHSD